MRTRSQPVALTRSHTVVNGATAANITLTGVGGASPGDMYVAFILANANISARPSGWTPLFVGNSSAFTSDLWWEVCVISRGPSDPAFTWTHASAYHEGALVCIQPTAANNVVALGSLSISGAVGTVTGTTLALRPLFVKDRSGKSVVLTTAMCWAGANTTVYGQPAGFTTRGPTAAASDLGVGSKESVPAGMITPGAFTNVVSDGSADYWLGATMSFNDFTPPSQVPDLTIPPESVFPAILNPLAWFRHMTRVRPALA
jgi:hypothetical protein